MSDEQNQEPEQTPATPPEPEKAPSHHRTAKHVLLRLSAPAWCTSFTFPAEAEGTLVIDRKGTEVPAKDAEALIQTAAKHGVTITEVSE